MWSLYALLSAFFAAIVAILAKIGMTGIDSNLATAIRTAVILVMTWSIVFISLPISNIKSLSTANWIFLILSGLATGLSWLFYFKALQLGPVSQVVSIDKLSIVITIILSFVILKETVSWQTLCGGFLIAAGTLIVLWK